MTIRKTLLIAFLLAGLVPSALLAWLAFAYASDALHLEIEQSLKVEAAAISQDIDKMLFERLQNAQTWSRLEVMQDIQVNDVDKRISKFLSELKAGYRDVYSELICIDARGAIVASSNPGVVGHAAQNIDTASISLPGDTSIRLEALQTENASGLQVLPIHADIQSDFDSSRLGTLRLLFDWSQIHRTLDQAERGKRSTIVVDQDGKVIAASSALRRGGTIMRALPRDWFDADGSVRSNGVGKRDGAFLNESELTVGSHRSQGYQHFSGFGWTTFVFQPSRHAFVPVRDMALIFVLLLSLSSILVAAMSTLIAGRISRPIAALSRLARNYRAGEQLPTVPAARGSEVAELSESFVHAVGQLDQSRAELIRASKLAAMGELSAMMAHEIRTPIGILRSGAQMLARETLLSDEGRELTSFIESETERLNGLVSLLLDGARTREPQLRRQDAGELIRHCVGLLSSEAEKKAIQVDVDLPETMMVECDGEQMTQVLLNLLHNAMQVLPTGGRIEVACRREAESILIEVSDSGPGIPNEELPRVFDPFFTKRDGGIGLGLSVVQRIVVAHRGSIEAGTSRFGGARFSIRLPSEQESL